MANKNTTPDLTSIEGIVQAQQDGLISAEDMVTLLKQHKEQNGGKLSVKHGSQGKGNISVYGLQKKFPVSLYPSQWRRLIDEAVPMIEQFLKEEKANLANEKFLERYAKEKAKERAAKEKDKD